MNTITIQVENASILHSLKKILSLMDGITIVKAGRSRAASHEPNKTTVQAINDVKAGKTFKASSVDDLLDQCLN